MSAILESYASDDRKRVDYAAISKSEEFRRYVNMTQDLQRVNIGSPEGVINRRSFFNDFLYLIGGYPYSLAIIENGILRCNQRSPYSIMKPFSTGDKRLEVALVKLNPLFHFGLCNGTKSSPNVRFFSPNRVLDELRGAAREIFENGGIEVDLEREPFIFHGFSSGSVEILDKSKKYLSGYLITWNQIKQNFDWSLNS
ncbi:unnamed protein product [Vicia faba]|uniref:DUF547 domain-containing protein n=1 Tax=Vicia faba TaxID=3906 RepID=A0AAV1AA54_VICFA|nr:unnamed protein product [Vicia faba]